jgi:hypothetical protein
VGVVIWERGRCGLGSIRETKVVRRMGDGN